MAPIIKRRIRTLYFSDSEVNVLLELVAKNSSVIENKNTDAVTKKDKQAAWLKITSLFNSSPGTNKRTVRELKLKYESLTKVTVLKKSVKRPKERVKLNLEEEQIKLIHLQMEAVTKEMRYKEYEHKLKIIELCRLFELRKELANRELDYREREHSLTLEQMQNDYNRELERQEIEI